MRVAAGRRAAAAGDAQGRDDRLLRPEGLDEPRRGARLRGPARGDDALLRRDAGRARAARRRDREVHRRRGDGGLRPPSPPRGRRPARRAGRRGHAGRARSAQRRAPAPLRRAAGEPHRREHRRGRRRRPFDGTAARDRRRRQRRRTAGAGRRRARGPARRAHVPARPRRRRRRGGRAAGAEREVRAGARLSARQRQRAATRRTARRPPRRSRAGARAARGGLRRRRCDRVRAPRDDRRDAGVGKSRLTAEFLDRIAGRALALEGRCLPYGDGITFWPLAEAVRRAAGS